uniref:Uncharacterized protein n=1 Tax=Timema tahoe TaxID=61484 RepID=A0A7R9IKF0_9NEOP|nr:unnamed protein product [Timema tahoe]
MADADNNFDDERIVTTPELRELRWTRASLEAGNFLPQRIVTTPELRELRWTRASLEAGNFLPQRDSYHSRATGATMDES